jgi:hypothetical protein
MKTRSILCFIVCITASVAVSCSKHREAVANTATPATPMPTPSEHHRLAPSGILYLIAYVAVTTDSGVTGFPAGTRVRFVEDKGDTIIVTDGRANIEVPSDKLTNDLDIAELASRRDAQAQEDLATYLAEQSAMGRSERAGQNEALAAEQRDIAARRAAASSASQYSNPLHRGPYHERGNLPVHRYIYRYDPPNP